MAEKKKKIDVRKADTLSDEDMKIREDLASPNPMRRQKAYGALFEKDKKKYKKTTSGMQRDR